MINNLQSDPNMDQDKVSKASRESFRDILPLTSSVSLSGTEIPKILVHTFTREETVESTLSSENNNGLNNL